MSHRSGFLVRRETAPSHTFDWSVLGADRPSNPNAPAPFRRVIECLNLRVRQIRPERSGRYGIVSPIGWFRRPSTDYTQVRMRRWSVKIKAALEHLRGSDQLLLVLSLVIGALVGLVVVAFILLTGRLAARMYPAGGAGWHRILVPVLGSLSTGFLLWRYFPIARGSGIPQTKFALFVSDGRIQFRTVVGKFFCCSASLASGIALGREGPSVQVGAGIASVVARNLGLNAKQVKALVPVGCAAALAAAFNT